MAELIEGVDKLCKLITIKAEFNSLAYLEKAVVLFGVYGAGPCHNAINDYNSTDLVEKYLQKEKLELFYFDVGFEDLNDLALEMDIVQVPTIGVYTYGVEIGRAIGQLSRYELIGFIESQYSSIINFSSAIQPN